MTSLLLINLPDVDLPVPGADPWHARPEDPAISVMTDFREHASVTIAATTNTDAALEHMKHAGVRCAFATSDARRVVGLITAYDIMGEKPIRHARAVSGRREDVLVRDIMTTVRDWKVAEVKQLEVSTVEDLRRKFQEPGLTHIPVVELNQEGRRQLRGLLSGSKVRRLLAGFDSTSTTK